MTARAASGTAKQARLRLLAPFAGGRGLSIIEEAAELAALLKAELHGIFLEEENVQRAAALPFTRVLSPTTGETLEFGPRELAAAYRAAAREARQALAAAGTRRTLAWSFEVLSESLLRERAGNAGPGDLILIAGSEARRWSQGEASLLATAKCVCLISSGEEPRPRRVRLHYRGRTEALKLAAHLAKALHASLQVDIAMRNEHEGRRATARVRSWLKRHGEAATLQKLRSEKTIGECLIPQGGEMLIVDEPCLEE